MTENHLTTTQIRELDRVFARGVTAPAVVKAHTLTELLVPMPDDAWEVRPDAA